MSERCEPEPEWRERDGWHWVQGAYSVGPMLWINFSGGFWQTDGEIAQLSPERAHHMGLVYLAPITPYSTVAALVEALKKCADDLEARVMREYSVGILTPGVALRQAEDLAPVDAARAALALYREAGR